MSHRFVSFFLIVLTVCFCQSAFSQTHETELFTIKPGQSVYVMAVKGECGNQISPAAVNGRALIIPNSGTERKTLSYAKPFPQATQVINQALINNKTFVVANSPEQADFIFHVCAAYTEDIMAPEAMRRMNIPSQLTYAEARVVPASVYRANKEAIFSPLWKAKTPDTQRPVPRGKSEGKKKKENNNLSQPQGMIVINGIATSIAPTMAADVPDLEDLTKYFLQDFAKIAPVKIPKAPPQLR